MASTDQPNATDSTVTSYHEGVSVIDILGGTREGPPSVLHHLECRQSDVATATRLTFRIRSAVTVGTSTDDDVRTVEGPTGHVPICGFEEVDVGQELRKSSVR